MTPKPIPQIGPREWIAWLFGRRIKYTIEGHSMEPLFHAGDTVLVCVTIDAEVGDSVVVVHPRTNRVLVKGIEEVNVEAGEALFSVRGLNTGHSEDSSSFGAITQKELIGRITCRF